MRFFPENKRHELFSYFMVIFDIVINANSMQFHQKVRVKESQLP